ncbi:MAG: heavy metal translocating P-type ATPase metal-binding domain-containing protein [Luteolibacter sp.]
MTDCTHCGTPFVATNYEQRFCCKGCEFVHDLIVEEGLDRYYTLKQDTPAKPVRSVPFEAHDFGWLEKEVAEAEAEGASKAAVEGEFSLEGISCIGCVWLMEKVFMRQPGALQADAHPATGRVHLRWMAGKMDLVNFAREMASFGYRLAPRRAGASESESGALGMRLGLCGAFMLNAMAFTLPSYLGMPETFAFSGIFQLITLLTATLSMCVGGSYFIGRAWRAVRLKMPHIDLPIALGLIAAFAGSIAGWALKLRGLLYFDFVSTFVFLMLLGRCLQLSAMEKNRHRLQRHRPVPESVVSPDREAPIGLQDLADGVRFQLEPGQAAPVAAVLENEKAEFSLEWINGEAEPCTFQAGRRLPSGAIHLGQAPVILRACETWDESLLAKLVKGDRQAVRVPALERLLKIYLIVVVLVGIGAMIWWCLNGAPARGLQVMISVFVVSCPCALGVALPMADEIAGSMMERMGVFIRQPLLWGRLCRVKTVIFDKTGTLTMERPVLMNPEVVNGLSSEERAALVRLASGSLHPVSRSLLESLGREGQILLRGLKSTEVRDVPGSGRFFEEDGVVWALGKPGWMGKDNQAGAWRSQVCPHDAVLTRDGVAICHFSFHESLRADAIAAVQWLKERHYRCVILSGDKPAKVMAAAQILKISAFDTHASLQPEEKETLVKNLDQRDTLYLGDGANDSLAFNAAWATGTPVVDCGLLENKADFYFMGESLNFLPMFLSLARRRRKVVRAAFGFALAYNLCVVAVALLGHMSPLLAAVFMPASSAISLIIITLGLKSGKRRRGKVDLLDHLRYPEGEGESQVSLPHAITSAERLRPSSL